MRPHGQVSTALRVWSLWLMLLYTALAIAHYGDTQVMLSASTTLQPSCGPRVRRSWSALSSKDKRLYRDAVSSAMASGHHTLFMEVAADVPSFVEAERTSGMVFWHRRFLLGYENMLRSLEPRFACLTIPFWDFFADYAKAATGVCSSLEECSQFLHEFGGSNGSQTHTTLGGVELPADAENGSCVNGLVSSFGDFSSFCESSQIRDYACSRCIPRGAWLDTNFPSGLGYASLARLVSLRYGFAWFSSNLQFGMKTSIHNAAGGAMTTYGAAADPIYYSIQATVDFIHELYYDCHVGRILTTAEKQMSTPNSSIYEMYAMEPADAAPNFMDNMTMFWSSPYSSTRFRVEEHPELAEFFAPLPTEYWYYASGENLWEGDSYTYDADNLYALLEAAGLSKNCNWSEHRHHAKTPRRGKLGLKPRFIQAPTTANEGVKAIARSFNAFVDVLNTSLARDVDFSDALEQSEIADCWWFNREVGAKDFSAAYRQNVGLPSDLHSACHWRLQEIRSGADHTRVRGWEYQYNHYMKMPDADLARVVSVSDENLKNSAKTSPSRQCKVPSEPVRSRSQNKH